MSTITDYKPYIAAETVKLATYITNKAAISAPTEQNVILWLNEYVNSQAAPLIELSNVRPNFEAIKQQFHSILSEQDAWKDIIQAGGGETILEFIAIIGSLGQDGIISALQETNLDTASLTSSVYTLMRMLGVHIRRKIPAHVDIKVRQFSSKEQIYIPIYSQFVIDGVGFFNRTAIIMNTNESYKTFRLYQGAVTMESYTSTGLPYQRFELGTNEYDISDTDLFCYLPDGTTYTRVEDGLWNHGKTEKVFYENTTPEGNTELLFGNNIYGAIPPVNSNLQFIYAKTAGPKFNTTQVGKSVSLVAFNTWVPDRIKRATSDETEAYTSLMTSGFNAVTTTPILGGAQEKDKEHYRAVGPFLNSGRKGMIRRNDHYAVALEYPGVVDVLFQGQKEMGSYNRNFINVVWITPVMEGGRAMSDPEWHEFTAFLDERAIWRLEWVHLPPVRIDLDIEARLYASIESDVQGLKSYAEYNVRDSFGLRRGSLGYTVTRSDLNDKLKLNYKNLRVDYVDLISPGFDYPVNKTEYLYINKLNVTVYPTDRNYISYTPPRPEDINPA
jgi:hypothetical protein